MTYKIPFLLSAAVGYALTVPAYAYNTTQNYALPSTQYSVKEHNWNNIFTQQLRESRATLWGNWSLSPDIKPGDIGIIDAATGTFTRLKTVSSAEINSQPIESSWFTSSTDVTKTKGDIDLDGKFNDPNTGTPIHAGVEFKWHFAKSFAFISEFALKEESSLNDLQNYIQKNRNTLDETANYYHYGDGNGGIDQGFGVITKVLYAYSGMNVGANSAKSQFSLAGTLAGLESMTGERSQSQGVGGKGFFSYKHETGSLDLHLWPGQGSKLAEHPVPIAYEFASFNGKQVIPVWIKDMSGLNLKVNNKLGSTYIAKVHMTYTVQDKKPSLQKVTKDATLTGGISTLFNDIPLDASNIDLTIRFIAGQEGSTCHMSWQEPLAKWLGGERFIDVFGRWPSAVKCTDKGSAPQLKQNKTIPNKTVI